MKRKRGVRGEGGKPTVAGAKRSSAEGFPRKPRAMHREILSRGGKSFKIGEVTEKKWI